MKIEIFFLALVALLGCWIANAADIAAESKRANEFFDKCWDETVARHPVDESFYGIKCTTTNWKICRMKKRRRTSRHCRINSRPCIAISSWNHSMARRS